MDPRDPVKLTQSEEVQTWFNMFKGDNASLSPEQLVEKIKSIELEIQKLKTQAYAALTLLREHKDAQKKAIDLVYGQKAMEYTPSRIKKDEILSTKREALGDMSKDEIAEALADFIRRKGAKK